MDNEEDFNKKFIELIKKFYGADVQYVRYDEVVIDGAMKPNSLALVYRNDIEALNELLEKEIPFGLGPGDHFPRLMDNMEGYNDPFGWMPFTSEEISRDGVDGDDYSYGIQWYKDREDEYPIQNFYIFTPVIFDLNEMI